MIVGDPQTFAIEAEATDLVDGWLLGHFRFWLGGAPVGNWDDTTDLRGCARWLADFATVPQNRREPRLDGLSATEVLQTAWDDVMSVQPDNMTSVAVIPNAFERLHISRLGMSSFDAFDIVLVEEADGSERCIWRDARTGEVGAQRLAGGEMETVAAEFCRVFPTLKFQVGVPRPPRP